MNSGAVLDSLRALAEPSTRQAALAALARDLGGEDMLLFAPDPELGILLPAPGLTQTLSGAAEWRIFLDECRRHGSHSGTLTTRAGSVPANGIAIAAGAAVLLGRNAWAADLTPLTPVLPVLCALFLNERRADAAEVRVALAREATERATTLARSLQELRMKLESALAEATAARMAAREHAARAEEMAEELRIQAGHLEEQTVELESLNEELSQRTREAEEARASAEAANRAKSGFLANMSHELRTPINAIIGYTELLDMGISGAVTDEQRHHFDRVRASSSHLLTLINDVLDLAKIESGHMDVAHSRCSVHPPILDAFTLLAPLAAERGVRLIDDCPTDSLSFFGDEDRVRQIVVNLLSNAVKFTARDGTVTVRCGVAEEAPAFTRLDGGPWTYIEVEDTGVGMTPDQARAVFQPFVQATGGNTRTHGGTGLGLTISRQLARLMGGDVSLRTEPGLGSTLRLWLPASAARVGALDETIRVGAS